MRSTSYTTVPYAPTPGLVWLLFLLITVLPAIGLSNGGSPEQSHSGDAAVTTQTGVTAGGEEHPAAAAPQPVTQNGSSGANDGKALSEKYDLALGKSVFNHDCLTCHGNSIRDAPRVGDMHAWQPRLDQGLDVLIQHALQGHGRMPPKGGYTELTDHEVISAVAYIYQIGTEILAQQDTPITHKGCDPVSNLDQCTPEELRRLLIMQMLWLLSGPHQ